MAGGAGEIDDRAASGYALHAHCDAHVIVHPVHAVPASTQCIERVSYRPRGIVLDALQVGAHGADAVAVHQLAERIGPGPFAASWALMSATF